MLPWILKLILGLTLLTPIVPMKHTQSEKPHIVILLGPPGVGKGTMGTKIKDHFHLPHISTGDLFRDNIKNKTDLGLKVKSILDSGALVSDEIVLAMLYKRVQEDDCARGYILDGFPRTLAQAESLSQYLNGKVHIDVINFSAKDDIVVDRISGRMTCKSCGAAYHTLSNPSKTSGKCDRCGEDLHQRADDKKEIVIERLNTYKIQTAPLIAYYQKKQLLKTVDCEKSIDDVFNEVCRVLKK